MTDNDNSNQPPGRPTDGQRVEAVANAIAEVLSSTCGLSGAWVPEAKAALAADPLVPWLEQRIAELEAGLREVKRELAPYAGAYTLTITTSNYPDARSYDILEDDGAIAREVIATIDALLGGEKG